MVSALPVRLVNLIAIAHPAVPSKQVFYESEDGALKPQIVLRRDSASDECTNLPVLGPLASCLSQHATVVDNDMTTSFATFFKAREQSKAEEIIRIFLVSGS